MVPSTMLSTYGPDRIDRIIRKYFTEDNEENEEV